MVLFYRHDFGCWFVCQSRFIVKGMLHNHISVKFSVIARNSNGFLYSVYVHLVLIEDEVQVDGSKGIFSGS